MENISTPLYHYTSEMNLPQIINSGFIALATTYIPKNEKPAAWFSTNQVWEPSATKNSKGMDHSETTMEEMADAIGLARIRVKWTEGIITWQEFKETSGIQPRIADSLEKCGREKGANPEQWYASYEPIDMSEWLSIEIWRNGRWILAKDTEVDELMEKEKRRKVYKVSYGSKIFNYESYEELSEEEIKEKVSPFIFDLIYSFRDRVQIKGSKKRLEHVLQQIMISLVVL